MATALTAPLPTTHTTLGRAVASHLPNTPNTSLFTPSQWRTLFSLTSAIISTTSTSNLSTPLNPIPDDALTSPTSGPSLLASSAASPANPGFTQKLTSLLSTSTTESTRRSLAFILDLLNSRAGCLLLTYSPRLFHAQPVEVREKLIQDWSDPAKSCLVPSMRSAILCVIGLTRMAWMRGCPEDWHDAVEYKDKSGSDNIPGKDFFEFNFIGPEEAEKPEDGEWDFVIVGSGLGGGVVAKKMAEAGLKTLVVEKGNWVPTSQLPMSEDMACAGLFDEGMMKASEDGSVALLAGSTFGGGSIVNWAASLQPQRFVREEWARELKLPGMVGGEFQDCLDEVCEKVGVEGEGVRQNHRNRVLLEAARKLGYQGEVIPQNASAEHEDGYCNYGCGGHEGERKNGMTHTYLPDAARAGAKFLTTFTAHHLNSDHSSVLTRSTSATSLSGHYGPSSLPLTIPAKHIILASGALHTPTLLLTSPHLPHHPQLGQNLYLHPATTLFSLYPHHTNPMEGSPMTSLVTSLENLNSKGQGVRIECPAMNPASVLGSIPWISSTEFKRILSQFNNLGAFVSLLRESNPGQVKVDGDGKPRVLYTPSKGDREMLFQGVEAMARLAFTAGAVKIFAPVAGMPAWDRPNPRSKPISTKSDGPESFAVGHAPPITPAGYPPPPTSEKDHTAELSLETWLSKLRRHCGGPVSSSSSKAALPVQGVQYASAHQMSTCRMSGDPKLGVCDEDGKVRGTRNVWCADASVLPSASGVNPMISVLGCGEWVARRCLESVEREGGLEGKKRVGGEGGSENERWPGEDLV